MTSLITAPATAWECYGQAISNGRFADSFEATENRPPIDVTTCKQVLTNLDDVTNPTVLKDLGPGCDYYVKVGFEVKADLTIEPGVTFVMAEKMSISFSSGELTAVGTPEKRIKFIGEQDKRGYWGRLVFRNPKATLAYVDIANGGSYCNSSFCEQASVVVQKANFAINHSSISTGKHFGMHLNTEANITEFANNAFCDIDLAPVSAYPTAVSNFASNNNFTGGQYPNDESIILLRNAWDLRGDLTWPNLGVPYSFNRDIVMKDGILSIEPGTTLIAGSGGRIEFSQNGYLSAIGTAEKPITFTASDTNSGWEGLIFKSNNTKINRLSHVNIKYGGNETDVWTANIKLDWNAIVEIDNSDSSNSKTHGIGCREPGTFNPQLRLGPNMTFSNNKYKDIDDDCVVTSIP